MTHTLTRSHIPLLAGIAGIFATFGAATVFDALHTWHFGAVSALIALGVWMLNHRRYRALADTPCSPIKSAPQGYIEIAGIGRPLDGTPLLSPLNYLPCLWYRVVVERRREQNWEKIDEEVSDASFILEDEEEGQGGSRCYVDPEGAQVIVQSKDVVTQGDTRTTQWLLVSGTRIHALGHFITHSQSVDRPSLNEEVRDKLADWKTSGEALRFDLDKSNDLNMEEWELARAAARREVQRERLDAARMPDLNRMVAPPDGRSFIITDMDSDRLAHRYRYGAWGSLLVFFLALAGTAWLWTNGD